MKLLNTGGKVTGIDWEMPFLRLSCFPASCERGKFIWNWAMSALQGEPKWWRVRKVSCAHPDLTRRIWAALMGTSPSPTACTICSFKLPSPHDSRQVSHHLSVMWRSDHTSRDWHCTQKVRGFFPHWRNKDLGSSSPLCLQPPLEGGAPQQHDLPSLFSGPEIVQAQRSAATCSAQQGLSWTWAFLTLYNTTFPSALPRPAALLPLFLLWPCCCGVATTPSCRVQLDGTSFHFSYSLNIIFTRQAERSWCLQSSPSLCCSELSFPRCQSLCQGSQMEKYQGWIKMQGRIAKFTGFHSKYCCRKCCQTVQVVDVTDCTSLLALSLDPQALYSNAGFEKTGFDDEERVMCLVNDLSATNLPARIQTIIPSFLCGEVSGYPYFSVDTFL